MRLKIYLALLALVLGAMEARADLRLAAVIGDHMVLQRETEAAVWGWAEPGAAVEVTPSWADAAVRARVDSRGRWNVALSTPGAGGPHTIRIRSGEDEIVVADVLVGEVWVCSGQSNMEWSIDASRPKGVDVDEYLKGLEAELPEMRLFDVQRAIAPQPLEDCEGAWQACSTENVRKFSAVGYWFGREIHHEVGVPVGLIGSNWGGTLAEAWTSAETLAGMPYFADALASVRRATEQTEVLEASFEQELASWWSGLGRSDPGTRGSWHAVGLDDSGWDTMELPREWKGTELEAFDGIAWFRRTVEVPAELDGQELTLELGPIDDMDTCWFNGQRVGGTEESGHWQTPRRYTVPGRAVRAGPNVIALRVFDSGGLGGLTGQARALAAKSGDATIPLAGQWRWRAGAAVPDLAPWPQLQPDFHHNSPTALHNGMIAPITPFAIRGAIWYQGESNRPRAHQYGTLFPAMIQDWRAKWGRADFPFLYVQIAPYDYRGDKGEAAELREAQTLALRVPNTGMAVTMDIGNPGDIHPKDKRPVGERLARWALAGTYGQEDLVVSGPLYRSMAVEDGAIRLSFDHVGGGLVARATREQGRGQLTHFTIAGEDREFVAATATIDGETIVVSSASVSKPVAVRYAWGAADEPNLSNAAGLPAPSFRTDTWPGVTKP